MLCLECECHTYGTNSSNCSSSGICTCNDGYIGDKCSECETEYYKNGYYCNGKFYFLYVHILSGFIHKLLIEFQTYVVGNCCVV